MKMSLMRDKNLLILIADHKFLFCLTIFHSNLFAFY